MKIIRNSENGQTLISLSRDFDLAASTMKIILKDPERTKDHVKYSAPLKSTAITKKHAVAVFETEKLLILWMEDKIQSNAPLSLRTIQAKARNRFEGVKVKSSDPKAKFMAINGWFHRFKTRANFYNVKVCGESVRADIKAAETCLEI
jgi:hypothetical protein